ncbi:MAG: hypothetical protein QX189_05890 [Methylococcales bacterium]
MKKQHLLSLLLCTTVLSGCASIISGSSSPVRIASTPEQADFTITNEDGIKVHSGITPSTVTLKSGAGYFDGASYSIDYSKDGYNPQTATLDSGVNGWYFGNLLFGGFLGLLVIDPATGAMFDLPDDLSVSLMKQSQQGTLDGTTKKAITPVMNQAVEQVPTPIYQPVPVAQSQVIQQPIVQSVTQTAVENTMPSYEQDYRQPQTHNSGKDLRGCLALVDNALIAKCVRDAK